MFFVSFSIKSLIKTRLNSQHYALKATLGYVLHPTVQASLKYDARIADIATGTGILLQDLAITLPSTCRFDGFDISDSQFPPADELPSNVRLQIADAKAPPPSSLHGQFDVVIIRYLVAGMDPQDWEIVARNMSLLLKPGGWLQWIEPSISQGSRILRGDPSIPISSAAQECAEALSTAVRKYDFFVDELPNVLRTVGFQNVTRETTSSDRVPELRAASWQVSRPFQTMWEKVEEAKGAQGKSKEYVAQRYEQMRKEAEAGAIYYRFDVYVHLSQKP